MTQKGRVVIRLSKDRVELLAVGKEVHLTQDSIPYIIKAEVGCCDSMRALLSRRQGRRMYHGMQYCPYCQAQLNHNHGPVYTKKSSALKGAKRVKDPITGKVRWVRPGDLHGHTQ